MDTKLKISLSHRTPSVTIQTCSPPGLQSPENGVTGLDHLETLLQTY